MLGRLLAAAAAQPSDQVIWQTLKHFPNTVTLFVSDCVLSEGTGCPDISSFGAINSINTLVRFLNVYQSSRFTSTVLGIIRTTALPSKKLM